MANLVSLSVLALGLVASVHGACFRDRILNITGPYGNVRQYCYIHDFKLNISVGGYVKSLDTCYEYHCYDHGLEACGFGVRAGVLVAQGCIVLNMACQPSFVQDPKSSYKCLFDPSGIPATVPTMPPPTQPKLIRPTPNADEFCDDPFITGPLRDQVCASSGSQQRITIATMAAMLLSTFFMYAIMN